MLSFRSIRLINTYFKQAQQQFKHMNFNTALDLYKEAVKQNPEHFQSRIGQSNCYVELGQYDEAMHILRNLRRRKTPTAIEEEVRLNLGRLYKKIGERHHAYEQFHRAIDLKGKHQLNAILSKLSCIQPTKQAMEQYMKSLDTVINSEKRQPYHYFEYGWIQYKLQKYDKAIASINKAMEQGLTIPDVMYYRAACHRKLNLLVECREDLGKCLDMDSNHIQSLVAMGDLSLRMDHHQQASNWYRKALNIDQRLSTVLYRMALCMFHLGNFTQAQLLLTKSLKLERKSTCYKLRALARICQAKWSMAQLDLSRTAQSNPANINTPKECAAMSKIYYRNGQFDLAFNCTEKGLELWPQDVVLLNLHGNNLKSLHRYHEALKFLKKATEMEPKNINFKYDLAHLYELKGDHSMCHQITQSIWQTVTQETKDTKKQEKNDETNQDKQSQQESQENKKQVDAIFDDIRKEPQPPVEQSQQSPKQVRSLLSNLRQRDPNSIQIHIAMVIMGRIIGKEDKATEERLFGMLKSEEDRQRVSTIVEQAVKLQNDEEHLRTLYEQSLYG